MQTAFSQVLVRTADPTPARRAANRLGMGSHQAVDRLQLLAQRYPYVLRMDIVQHFASNDHAILLNILSRQIPEPPEPDVMALVERIVASGEGVLADTYRYVDDLACFSDTSGSSGSGRPRSSSASPGCV